MQKHAVALCLALCTSSSFAAAQSSQLSDGWNLYEYTMTFSGFAVPKDVVGQALPAETIFTNASGAGDVALTCLLDKLSSTIEIKDTDFAAFVLGQPDTRRARFRNVRLIVNDEKISYNQWTYVPKHKVLLARRQSDTNALYNAIVRGDKVSIKVSGGKIIKLNLPQKDDAFAEFGGACNLGRNR